MKNKLSLLLSIVLLASACSVRTQKQAPPAQQFIEAALKVNPEERELLILEWIDKYGLPEFMNQKARIDVEMLTEEGDTIRAYYYAMPDYLCVGNNEDYLRIPMQPKTAQKIADELGCFLSTKKICDDIYKQAVVKLEPHPLTQDRDSFYTFVTHNQIVENQRDKRIGLIAGHKKDIILTQKVIEDTRPNRVALYGWHKVDGNPIQPIYTGHIDWYVDYSHGMRLVDRTIYVEGEPMDYIEVLTHPVYRQFICDEAVCSHTAYPY